MKKTQLRRETIRHLTTIDLRAARGGYQGPSGSQEPSGATCPPPKNGEGSGCLTGG